MIGCHWKDNLISLSLSSQCSSFPFDPLEKHSLMKISSSDIYIIFSFAYNQLWNWGVKIKGFSNEIKVQPAEKEYCRIWQRKKHDIQSLKNFPPFLVLPTFFIFDQLENHFSNSSALIDFLFLFPAKNLSDFFMKSCDKKRVFQWNRSSSWKRKMVASGWKTSPSADLIASILDHHSGFFRVRWSFDKGREALIEFPTFVRARPARRGGGVAHSSN